MMDPADIADHWYETNEYDSEPDTVQTLVIEPAFCSWCPDNRQRRGTQTEKFGVCCVECYLEITGGMSSLKAVS